MEERVVEWDEHKSKVVMKFECTKKKVSTFTLECTEKKTTELENQDIDKLLEAELESSERL